MTVIAIMPAYNAAKTLETTYASIPMDIVDKIILTDDVSEDETVEIAISFDLISIEIPPKGPDLRSALKIARTYSEKCECELRPHSPLGAGSVK